MTDPSRTAALAILLLGDDSARRLVVSWPTIEGGPADRRTLNDWAAAAGVSRTVARRVAVVLLRHGICRPDHTVDPEAARLVQHVAAEAIRSAKRGHR